MTAPAVAAPYLAEVALLGFAGLAKLGRPQTTVLALKRTKLPATRALVRTGASAELVVAVAALAHPGAITGTLVALSYAGFALFVAIALRYRWPLSSCGCFAKPDTVPTGAHAVLNAGAAVCAVLWAASGPSSLPGIFSRQPWGGAPLGLVTAVVALLAYIVWTNPLPSISKGTGR
jgi:hypothetical protein